MPGHFRRGSFNPRSFCSLNFVFQSAIGFALAPFAVRLSRGDLTLFDVVNFVSYLTILIGVVQLGILGLVSLFPKPSSRLIAALALEASWIFLCAFSFFVYFKLGLHLDHPVVLDLVRLTDGNLGIELTLQRWLLLGLSLGLIALYLYGLAILRAKPFETLVARLWQRSNRIRGLGLSSVFGVYLLVVAAYGDWGALQVSALPGASLLSIVFSDPISAVLKKDFVASEPVQLAKKPDVDIVMADPFRADGVSAEMSRRLFEMSSGKSCINSRRHYAGSHMTSYGSFSLWHGLESYLYRPVNMGRWKSVVLETLRSNGYRTMAFDASGLTSYVPSVVSPNEFDRYWTFLDRSRGALEDLAAVEKFKAAWKLRDPRVPTVSFIFLYSTHDPYFYLEDDGRLPAKLGNEDRIRYWKSVRFVSSLVERVVAGLDPKTIFVFTGDHGEELGEFGSVGHSGVRFEDVRTRVPLVFCMPEIDDAKVEFSSHADIWPTIFDWSGVAADWRKRSFTGRSLLRADEARRSIPLTGADFPFYGRQMALVVPDGKLLLHAKGPSLTTS